MFAFKCYHGAIPVISEKESGIGRQLVFKDSWCHLLHPLPTTSKNHQKCIPHALWVNVQPGPLLASGTPRCKRDSWQSSHVLAFCSMAWSNFDHHMYHITSSTSSAESIEKLQAIFALLSVIMQHHSQCRIPAVYTGERDSPVLHTTSRQENRADLQARHSCKLDSSSG